MLLSWRRRHCLETHGRDDVGTPTFSFIGSKNSFGWAAQARFIGRQRRRCSGISDRRRKSRPGRGGASYFWKDDITQHSVIAERHAARAGHRFVYIKSMLIRALGMGEMAAESKEFFSVELSEHEVGWLKTREPRDFVSCEAVPCPQCRPAPAIWETWIQVE